MSTLCIDELATDLKRRWGWSGSATHVPAGADCPLLARSKGDPESAVSPRPVAVLPDWIKPGRGHAGPPGIAAFHGKGSPSMG
jgi:hypothetical protein